MTKTEQQLVVLLEHMAPRLERYATDPYFNRIDESVKQILLEARQVVDEVRSK